MSFSGSTDNFAAPKQEALGVRPSKTSTNQQARPMPWHSGTQPHGVTWLGQPFNVKADPIQKEAGKEEITVGHDYYIGCAGLICAGPVDLVHQIYFDDELLWEGELWRSGNSVSITIPGRGVMRFYWGTQSQGIDSSLAALATPSGDNPVEIHPAYRGQAYFVFDSLYLGANRTSAPQIVMVLGRFPQPAWMSAEANLRGDANPLAAPADWIENSLLGLGQESVIDATSWDGAATRLDSECFGISPILTEEERLGKALLQVAESVDGFLIPKADGTLGFGLRRSESTEGIAHLDETDCLEPPKVESSPSSARVSETRLTFTNREIGWQEDLAQYFDLATRAIEVESGSQSLQRRWITRPNVAAGVAQIFGEEAALPKTEGSIQILRASLGALDLGMLFYLSYPHAGICRWLCRVTRLLWPSPASPEVTVHFRVETLLRSGLFSKPVTDKAPEPVRHVAKPAEHVRILELPRLTVPDPKPAFLALVERPTSLTTGAHLHQLIDGSFQRIHTFTDFAKRGTLDTVFAAGDLFDEVGFTVTMGGIDNTLQVGDQDSALSLRLLALVGDELIAAFDATLVGPGQYQMKAIRGRLGTDILSHGIGEEVWFFSPDINSAFPRETDDPTQTFKIQPFIKPTQEPVGLEECESLEVAYTHKWARPYSPGNVIVNEAYSDPVYEAGGDIAISWSPFDTFEFGILDRWKLSQEENPIGVVRVLDQFGSLVFEHVAGIGEFGWTLSNAQLVEAFGSEPDTLILRLHQRIGSLDSEDFVEITVTQS